MLINAKDARALAESSLFEIRDVSLEEIAESIRKAIKKGHTKCSVWIRKEIADDIEWILSHTFDYTISYDDYSFPIKSDCYYMTISW